MMLNNRLKILVTREDCCGDMVLMSSFLRELRNIYRDAFISLICSSANAKVAKYCPYVDEVLINNAGYTYRKEYAERDDKVCKALADHLKDYDVCFTLHNSPFCYSMLLAYYTGAEKRIGFSSKRYDPIAKKYISSETKLSTDVFPFSHQTRHISRRAVDLLEEYTKSVNLDDSLEVWYSDKEINKASELILPFKQAAGGKLIALVPSASKNRKIWPAEKYAELIERILLQETDTGAVILGGDDTKPIEDIIMSLLKKRGLSSRILSLCGELSYPESSALMAECDMYIGNDTGLMHVAAALKKPVLLMNCYPADLDMLVSSFPILYEPYMVPSVTVLPEHALDGCNDYLYRYGCNSDDVHCIATIDVDTAIAAYEQLQECIADNNEHTVFFYRDSIHNSYRIVPYSEHVRE